MIFVWGWGYKYVSYKLGDLIRRINKASIHLWFAWSTSLPVSPYLKSLSMVAANKLLHLLEAFSTQWYLFSASQNHHLVFFLLEAFNNIIQYQFDGKALLQRTKNKG